ncbi:ISL3 family transposase [Saccharopolyspora hirsuta]|uniref:ISL3 family transposase n=1 Tax=Saccharopolyspora hirsuta TaxID=1837 RepID=A0A5M7BZ16_SACHI|nr:ISL3 family transposase [Saccharopolyspora hirsuta]KAA5833348.1 ISL3 family transposase [Saccharopolyspora hirsuta]
MPESSLWRALLGVDRRTVIEDVAFDEAAERVVVHVRPRKRMRAVCGRCGRWCGRYDRGAGRRRWRALDLGTVQVHLEAAAPRVRCREHGPAVARLPWARHGAGHTYAFDDTVAWLAVRTSKSAVCQLMRIAWRTVGAIVARVWADTETQIDRFAGLRRIGIDEISYKRHHRYLTVVVDHDTGRLVWAVPGHDSATLNRFFDVLGDGRAAEITHVSADAAAWIADTVARRAPNAIRCADPFHVVAWATEALDTERRRAWNDARALARIEGKRGAGRPRADSPARPGHETTKKLKDSRYALWKNPEDLTGNQQAKLAWIATTDRRLYRAYLLKEGLRHAFKIKGEAGKQALDKWIGWARRCRIPVFVKLQKRIVKHRTAINAALEHGLSQGLTESMNTKIRLMTRIAFGFRSPQALIALAMLAHGGHPPTLPKRA